MCRVLCRARAELNRRDQRRQVSHRYAREVNGACGLLPGYSPKPGATMIRNRIVHRHFREPGYAFGSRLRRGGWAIQERRPGHRRHCGAISFRKYWQPKETYVTGPPW